MVTDPDPPPSVTTDAPEAPAGPAWFRAQQTGPFADPGELVGTVFNAGGMVWTIDGKWKNILRGTADGVNWVTLNFAKAGLPKKAGIATRSGCGDQGAVIEEHGDGFTIVLTDSYAKGLPDYIFHRFYLVEVVGGEVVGFTSSQGSPLETLLHRSDGKMYRPYCIGGLTTVGDARYMTGIGDWFIPGATDGGEGFTAVLRADGSWEYIVEPGTPFGDGWHYTINGMVALGDTLTMVGQVSGDEGEEDGIDIWVSEDGYGWERTRIPLGNVGRFTYHVAHGGAGLAVLGAEEVDTDHEKVTVATSQDGRTWTTTVLSEAGQFRGLVVDDDGFRVIGLDGRIPGSVSTMWSSADGQEWTSEEIDLPTELIADQYAPTVGIPVVALGEGLLTVVGNTLYVTGLDWPAAA